MHSIDMMKNWEITKVAIEKTLPNSPYQLSNASLARKNTAMRPLSICIAFANHITFLKFSMVIWTCLWLNTLKVLMDLSISIRSKHLNVTSHHNSYVEIRFFHLKHHLTQCKEQESNNKTKRSPLNRQIQKLMSN